MPLATGTILGPYEILAPIGAGGMGEVYRARDSRLRRDVALKVSAERFSERFEREARAVAALNHPNICHLYDVGPDYLVMEYIDGKALSGPLPVEKALQYGVQILDALDAAHRKGIIHHDLKPANILVTKAGIKLLDFGLAKHLESTETDPEESTRTMALTGENVILGTLPYMSPEQLQGKRADARSDLFAFGLVLYEMVAGKRAFSGDSRASLIASILKENPAPLSTITGVAIPPPVDSVIGTCLEKDPDDRWQTARDLRRELVRITSGASNQLDPAARTAIRKRERLWMALAGFVSVVCVLLGAAYFWTTPVREIPVRASLLAPEDGVTFVTDPNLGGFAFSPDGRTLVFGGESNGKRMFYLRAMESGEASSIPGTENAGKPSWSPDGRSIVFFADRRVKRLDLAGGDPVALADGGNRGLSWNGNGVILFSSNASAGFPKGIWRTSAEGGAPLQVTTVNAGAGEDAHYWPQFLPDGKHFLYLVRGQGREQNAIFMGSLDDAPAQARRTRIVASSYRAQFVPAVHGGDGYLVFLDGTTLFAQRFSPRAPRLKGDRTPLARDVSTIETNGSADFAASTDGKLVYGTGVRQLEALVWRDRSGGTQPTAADPANLLDFRVSPDGARALVSVRDSLSGRADIYIEDLVRGGKTLIARNPIGSFSTGVWSPDGRAVAYDTPQGLFKISANGAGSPERLWKDEGTIESWSSDGRFLLYFVSDEHAKGQIWVLPLTGNRQPYLYLQTDAAVSGGQFSPDGRWVAYRSTESGTGQIYIQSFPPGKGKWQISNDGGIQPRWREDGKELFYGSGGSGAAKLMAASITVAGDLVIAGTPQPVADYFHLPSGSSLGVADNGRRFLVAEPVKAVAKPLTLLLNWQSAAGK